MSGEPGSGENHNVGLVFAVMQHSYTDDQVLESGSKTATQARGIERNDSDFEELPPFELQEPEDYSHDLRSSSAKDEYAERMKLYKAPSPPELEESPNGDEADYSWDPNVANAVDETIREAIPGLGRPRRWRKGKECCETKVFTTERSCLRRCAYYFFPEKTLKVHNDKMGDQDSSEYLRDVSKYQEINRRMLFSRAQQRWMTKAIGNPDWTMSNGEKCAV